MLEISFVLHNFARGEDLFYSFKIERIIWCILVDKSNELTWTTDLNLLIVMTQTRKSPILTKLVYFLEKVYQLVYFALRNSKKFELQSGRETIAYSL